MSKTPRSNQAEGNPIQCATDLSKATLGTFQKGMTGLYETIIMSLWVDLVYQVTLLHLFNFPEWCCQEVTSGIDLQILLAIPIKEIR